MIFSFRLHFKKATSSVSRTPSSVQQKTFVKPTNKSSRQFKETLGFESTFSSSFSSCRSAFSSSTGTTTELFALLHFLLKIKVRAIFVENFNFISCPTETTISSFTGMIKEPLHSNLRRTVGNVKLK